MTKSLIDVWIAEETTVSIHTMRADRVTKIVHSNDRGLSCRGMNDHADILWFVPWDDICTIMQCETE